MVSIPKEKIEEARQMDLYTYLQRTSPDELIHVTGKTYCTQEHDSLKISNGKWYWFSRGFGGRSALDYLIKVKNIPFPAAVEMILGECAVNRYEPPKQVSQEPRTRRLLIPQIAKNAENVTAYLMGRGVHPVIIDYCLEHNLLFETENTKAAVFVGYDKENQARYAAIRSTTNAYKGEVSGSDKHYSFVLHPGSDSGRVHIFESAIDLLSFATLQLLEGHDWKKDTLLSLAGVFQVKRDSVLPIALEQYLKDYPGTAELHLHLDNDEVGRGAAKGIMDSLSGRVKVFDEPPGCGKDVNEDLKMRVGIKRKEEYAR